MAFDWKNEIHGPLLREARLSEEWSRAQLADRLGVSYPSVRNWEEGTNSPMGANFDAIINLFGQERFMAPDQDQISVENHALGNWIRHRREELQMSRQELVDRARISYPTLLNLETGRTVNPQQRTLERIEQALGQEVPDAVDEEMAEAAEVGVDVGVFTDFDPHAWDDLPDVPGVYVFYDVSDRPIYVGKSDKISGRIKNGHWEKFWYRPPIVYQAAFVRIDDPRLRDQIERVMIRFLKSNAVINKQLVAR